MVVVSEFEGFRRKDKRSVEVVRFAIRATLSSGATAALPSCAALMPPPPPLRGERETERERDGIRTLAVDEEPEVVVGVVLLELLHGDLLGFGHFGD